MKSWRISSSLLAVVLTPLLFAPSRVMGQGASDSKEFLVYFGTYTRNQSKGIYACRFNAATGKLDSLGLAAEITNPSFLAIHPNRQFLYAVSETADYDDNKSGSVSAFRIDKSTGKLTRLNEVSSRGGAPCHINVDQTGKMVAVANYTGGSVAAFPVKADGRLGEASAFVQHSGSSVDPRRQRGPHAHSSDFSPDNRFLMVSDLGLDQVLIYRADPAKGSLVPNDPPFGKVDPGSGPRHLAFHPNQRYVYVINEMASTVTAFDYDAQKGALKAMQTVSTLPAGFSGDNTTAEIEIHPSGKFVYGSNRGDDSIAVFAVNYNTGKLTLIENVSTRGKTPRSFAIDPTGSYLFAANQASDSVVVFRIDSRTGRLSPTGETLNVYFPVCVRFMALD